MCIEVEYECRDEISIGTIFDPAMSTLTSQIGAGGRIWGRGSKRDIEIAAKRRQIAQMFGLRGIGKSWVGF